MYTLFVMLLYVLLITIIKNLIDALIVEFERYIYTYIDIFSVQKYEDKKQVTYYLYLKYFSIIRCFNTIIRNSWFQNLIRLIFPHDIKICAYKSTLIF